MFLLLMTFWTISFQNFSKNVADILKTWRMSSVTLFLSATQGTPCKLNIRSLHRKTVKLGKGWKQFYLINGIVKNTTLRFHFNYATKLRVNVTIIWTNNVWFTKTPCLVTLLFLFLFFCSSLYKNITLS